MRQHRWSRVLKTVSLAHVCTQCAAKRHQLNADKTEILWFGSAANLRKLSADELNIRVGQSVVKPVTTVRNFGVLIDAELSMRDHVSRLAQMCYFHLLRRLRSVRRQLGQDVTERLVCALVWRAELTFIHFSDIRNNYSRYLKKTILDIPKHVRILDIQNSYFGYPKQLFRISIIGLTIFDITH